VYCPGENAQQASRFADGDGLTCYVGGTSPRRIRTLLLMLGNSPIDFLTKRSVSFSHEWIQPRNLLTLPSLASKIFHDLLSLSDRSTLLLCSRHTDPMKIMSFASGFSDFRNSVRKTRSFIPCSFKREKNRATVVAVCSSVALSLLFFALLAGHQDFTKPFSQHLNVRLLLVGELVNSASILEYC